MTFALIVIVALVVVGAAWCYNSLLRMRNYVKSGWADVDVYLKRRSELIPNLVETTKGYSGYERDVLENVAKARSTANIGDRAQVEEAIAGRVVQLIALAEQYPELKASTNFIQLQQELAETENKIASARQYYNGAVRDYNTLVEAFPTGLFARAFGFRHADFFSIDTMSERSTPKASF